MALDTKKKKITAGVFGALAILAAGTALAGSGVLNREGVYIQTYERKAEMGYCTVLVYMDGSDLESDYGMAASDLQEMEETVAYIDSEGMELHVVVEAGGSAAWQYEPMQDKEYGRFCITGEGVSDVEEPGLRDMGRSDTLSDFINYGIQSYPAEHYGLICWNHGAGQIQGFGSDTNFEDSSLSMRELREALEESDMKSSFDFVGMDACLMGNLELVSVFEDKADYLIASEELEPQYGYNYSWMEVLKPEDSGGKTLGRRAGEAMLATYDEFYQDKDYKLTLSLIDVNAYEEFHHCFDRLIEQISGVLTEREYQELGQKRSRLPGFGKRSESAVAEQVDLMALLDTFAGLEKVSIHYEFTETVQVLKETYDKLVIHSASKGYANAPCGLSIYLPSGDNDWLVDDMEVYGTAGFCEKYQKLMEDYAKYLMKENHMEWREPSRKDNCVVLKIEPDMVDDIADAYVTAFYRGADGNVYLLSADGDVTLDRKGFLRAEPENVFWGMQGQILSLVENYDLEYETEYISPVLYKKADGDWIPCNMTISFSDTIPDGAIRTIAPIEVAKQEYELEKGDRIIPLYPLHQTEEDVGAVQEPDKDSDVMSKVDGKIYDGNYYMGDIFSIDDLEAGDGELEMISVEDEAGINYGFLIRDTKMGLYYTDIV